MKGHKMFPRNVVINDVELNWARLVKPVNPFGTEQYELQIATADANKKAEIEKSTGLSMKEKDGKFILSLKRKAKRKDGSDNGAPRVVDSAKAPVDGMTIGNGSIGNVIVFQFEYEYAGRKGISSSLTAVQVTKLEKYEAKSNVDFDVIGDAPAAAPSKDLF